MSILSKLKEAIGKIANRIRHIRKREDVIIFEEKPAKELEKKEIPQVEKQIEKTDKEIEKTKEQIKELPKEQKEPLEKRIKQKEMELKRIQERILKKKKLIKKRKKLEKERKRVEFIHRYYFECKVITSPHYISKHYFNYSSKLKEPNDFKAIKLHNFHYPEHRILTYKWISTERKEYILIK
jgi:hypothetical protein